MRCAVFVLLVSAAWQAEGAESGSPLVKWPVRNGDFSTSQGWGRPTDWDPATNSGKHNFKMHPSATFVGQPSAAVIETVEAGSAYYFQKLHLMEGDYRFAVEFRGTEGAAARISFSSGTRKFAGKPTNVRGEWKPLELDVSAPAGEAAISLMAISSPGQKVEFRNAKLVIKRLTSAPVAFDDGTQLGGLVLPDKPSLAEQYACYELQRSIFKMSGLVPGLKGRDRIFDGKLIYLGRAGQNQRQRLEGLPDDSYVTHSEGDRITLVGKTDQGTLYAVYDFLHQQGCRWVVPGKLGEIVPRREALIDCRSKVESPDYECRGIMVLAQDFFPGGGEERGWISVNLDDYYDWCLRNRLNAIWFAGVQSYDFGEHRGHGWVQLLNHAYGSLIAPHAEYFEDHPEWYPLVKGKRMPRCDIGPRLVNQLCVSNRDLRRYTVGVVLDYFKKNPMAKAFPLSPMDGPSFWCECAECKKLDPPGLDWSKHTTEGHISGMTDRAINYANEVAEELSKVYPNKLIEMYAYGYTLTPPVREKVHKSVFIKYANLSGGRGTGPLGRSMMDENVPIWQEWRKQLEGWRAAGATLAFYNYLEWEHPDLTLFWFYDTVDVLKNLNRRYNCRMLLGETENNILVSAMLYNVIARTSWDVDTDYQGVIRDLCEKFYGPIADELREYNTMMDHAIRKSNAWQKEDWRPNNHLDIPLEVLEAGRKLLEGAAAKAKDHEAVSRRLAYARFGHAYLTYVRALNEKTRTPKTAEIARESFDSANALRLEHGIMVKLPSVRQLKTFYYPPVPGDRK